jgi:DNA-directed RNA polymerase subunit beta'
VLFNSVLPEGMLFYNIPMRSSELARVISDCYQALGRRKTIDLLDDMNRDRASSGAPRAACRSPPTT